MPLMDRLLTAGFRHNSRRLTRFQAPQASETLPPPDTERRYMLYLHVPFCVVLCPFCSFHRVCFAEDKATRYFASLRREIEMAHEAGYRFSDIYVGGGTPTVMPDELARTLERVQQLSNIGSISIETNPDDLTPEVMSRMRDAGVTRLSVGIQSLDDRLLKQMDRHDKYGSASQTLQRLEGAGGYFDTLNADMIFNLPEQDEASLLRDVERITTIDAVNQVTFYPLMSASSTMRKMLKTMGEVDFNREGRMYELILDALPNSFTPSSAWCFSRGTSSVDEYVIENEEYLGLGSGSLSYLDGMLYSSTFSLNHYNRQIEAGRFGISRRQPLTRRDRLRYFMLMNLFGIRLDKQLAERRYPGFFRKLAPEILGLKLIGAVRDEGDHLVLTRRGMRIWILIMREFFMAVSDFRDLMRHAIKEELDAPGPLRIRLPTPEIRPTAK
ncbi:MAG: coproporphyrinogen III oxidase family protein [Wenzhouxiangellaceae bacterium]|nr:coproporphyrinogen III oxidase family protein [Wenzhouxiangellaceae bacterium]